MTVILDLRFVFIFLLEFYIEFFYFNIFIPNMCLSTFLVLSLYLNELNSVHKIFTAELHFQLLFSQISLYSWMLYFLNCSALEIADISRKADIGHASVLTNHSFSLYHVSLVPRDSYNCYRLHIHKKLCPDEEMQLSFL